MVKIKQGTHSSFKFPSLVIGEDKMVYKVKFTPSCAYDIGIADQLDINKLFGVGYFPHHHRNSVRFGWRYVIGMDAIEILAYYYADGHRMYEHVCYVNIGTNYAFVLHILPDGHLFTVIDDDAKYIAGDLLINHVKGRNLGYTLHPSFGGNQKAPHDIYIDMKKVKE